jgi:type II secretory pathway pseudopilin PulG
VSDVSEISVVASEDEEDKDLLPIPDWLLILILVIIIVSVLIYLAVVKRRLKKQKRILQMAEEYHRNQLREQELRSAQAGVAVPRPPAQKAEKSPEPEEPDESDELDEPLLDFS